MKLQLNATRFVFLLAFVAAIIGFSAFRQTDSTHQKYFRDGDQRGDDTTTRRKRDRSENEFNLGQLEEHMQKLEEHMQQLEKHKSIDFNKLQFELDEKLKKIDMDEMVKKIDQAMSKIDLKKMQAELQNSTKDLARINMDDVKKQMEKVKHEMKLHQLDMNVNMEKVKKQVEQGMEQAKIGMQHAKEEMENLKKFTDALEKDGLIDKSKAFKLEVKDGELYLDDVKQSKEINEKYKSYIQGKSWTIKNDPDEKKKVLI